MSSRNSSRNILTDPELWALLFLNSWLLYASYIGKIGTSTTIFIYYCQSVLIGIFHFIRLSVYAREGTSAGWSFKPAWFFALHYGGFHFIYFFFVIILMAGSKDLIPFSLSFAAGMVLCFFLNGLVSLFSLIKEDQQPDAIETGVLFFLPYLRIVPMHLFIILGISGGTSNWMISYQNSFLIFIGLKTFSDILMHILTNRTWRQRRPRVIGKFI